MLDTAAAFAYALEWVHVMNAFAMLEWVYVMNEFHLLPSGECK